MSSPTTFQGYRKIGRDIGWSLSILNTLALTILAYFSWASPYWHSVVTDKFDVIDRNISYMEKTQGVRSGFIAEMRVALRNMCHVSQVDTHLLSKPFVPSLKLFEIDNILSQTLLPRIHLLSAPEQEHIIQTLYAQKAAKQIVTQSKVSEDDETASALIARVRGTFVEYQENLEITLSIMEGVHMSSKAVIEALYQDKYKLSEQLDFQNRPTIIVSTPTIVDSKTIVQQCKERVVQGERRS